MSFKEFDLSDYIEALEIFKNSNADVVIKHWGTMENFDMFLQKIKDDESEVARLAIKQYGSIEKYTQAMKYNLEHFSEIMEHWQSQIPEEMKENDPFQQLASHKEKDASSDEVQHIVQKIITSAQEKAPSELIWNPKDHCNAVIGAYSSDYVKAIFDSKHGKGSCDYIVTAFRYYLEHHQQSNAPQQAGEA